MRSSRLPGFFAFVALLVVLFAPRVAYAGYTHYWEWHGRPDPKALDACLADMTRIVEARRSILSDGRGRTGSAAVFSDSYRFGDAGEPVPEIAFNGIGDDAHEMFGFPLAPFTSDDPSFQFTKTAYKPYDEVATACLIVARDYFNKDVLAIHSDGTWPEWSAGALLYMRVLGRVPHDPIDAEDEEVGENGGAGEAPQSSPEAAEAQAKIDRKTLWKNLGMSAFVLVALGVAYWLTRKSR